MKTPETSLRYLKGIGPKRAESFKKAGINTVEDILYNFARRYEDRRKVTPISELKEGESAIIEAKVLAKAGRRSWQRRNFHILELVVEDATGKIPVVWFNQSYLKDYFKIGSSIILFGKAQKHESGLQIVAPEFEIVAGAKDTSLDIGRIVPVYPAIEGVSQRYMRRLIYRALEEYLPFVQDILPYDIRKRKNLLNIAKALREIHFPQDFDLQKEAYRRLSFEEFFLFTMPILLRKLKERLKRRLPHVTDGELIRKFESSLSFSLTSAQKRVIDEIRQDMGRPFVMRRLLQGDVGSGKTVVAVYCAVIAIQGGYQAAFMVPTEILARQHFEKISYELGVGSLELKKIRVALLTSSLTQKERKVLLQDIAEGKIDLVIGTHALLEEKVSFKNLGLVVIDEQHKFGVSQRAALPEKGGQPDILIMTATPIPRTLAITLYGDLDISVIDELPAGRKPVATRWLKENERKELYGFLRTRLKQGRQAYIVYPIITESLVLDLRAAEEMYGELKDEFKEFRLGLVHGQMKQGMQDKAMSDFRAGKIDILVSTTVLEVGIDVPNATVMVIEHAERFGLAQLHQLRGRVGRGTEESFCILVAQPVTPQAEARIEIMSRTNDGFRIAEEDLKIRGPGEFFGDRQHGLSELKIANPLAQMQLLRSARQEAMSLVNADPNLCSKQNQGIKEEMKKRFPHYEEFMKAG